MVCEESPSPSPSPSETTAPSLELPKFDSSPESSFRELDDAFLQTQTRIWLGEVLQIKLDEQLIISELLADGELLFQVSKVVWKLLLAKHMELRHIRPFKSQPFASKKNGWRYRPYSNVDSFLKICKIVGLTGIDLFTPSDVVERRNTRRVCMCIRSFSKKSRSMNINVPDFDIVTCMVTMPKDLVGYIRRNIELSHSILADSSSYYLQKHAGGKSRQGYSVTRSTREYEAYSNQSDDTEIKHAVLQFDGLHDDLCDYTSEINYNVLSPMVESFFISEDLDHMDIQNKQRNEVSNDEFELLCSEESLQNHNSENIDHDYKLTWPSSPCGNLHIDFSDMTSDLDTRVEQVEESRIMDLDYFEHDLLRDNESFNLHNNKNDQWNKVKEYESQDIMKCKETAYGSTFDARYTYFVKEFEETEHSLCSRDCYFCNTNSSDRAVSHSTAISSTQLKRYLAYEDRKSEVDLKSLDNASCDQSEELLSSQSYSLPEFCKWDQKGKFAMTPSRAEDNKSCACVLEGGSHKETTPCKQNASEVLMSKVMLSSVPNKDVVSAAVVKLGTDGKELKNDCPDLALNALGVDDCEKCPTNGNGANDFGGRGVTTQDIGVIGQRVLHVITNDVVVPTECDEDVSHSGSCLTNQSSKLECNSHQECQYNMDPMDPVYLSDHTSEVLIQEETKPEEECVHSFENLVETEEGSLEIPKGKPQKKLLLKSVLGGTAAVGLLLMFLHLRRNSGEKDAQPSKASSHKGEVKIQKYSPRKVKRSTTREVYPAEKLKLK